MKLLIVGNCILLDIHYVGLSTRSCLFKFVNVVKLILSIGILLIMISSVFKMEIQCIMLTDCQLVSVSFYIGLKLLILNNFSNVLVNSKRKLVYPVNIYLKSYFKLIIISLIESISIGLLRIQINFSNVSLLMIFPEDLESRREVGL